MTELLTQAEEIQKKCQGTAQRFWDRLQARLGFEKNSQQVTTLPTRVRPVTLSVMNQKGGCGKSTTVVNLGACLAASGYRVLIVDMDPQGHASLGLGIRGEEMEKTIYDLLMNADLEIQNVIQKTGIATLDVLPASSKLAAAQLELSYFPQREGILRKACQGLREPYDFILIDCPPTLNLLTINALAFTQHVLIPVQMHVYTLEGMKELMRTIRTVQKCYNDRLDVFGILATMFDPRMGITSDILKSLRDYFGPLVLETVIHLNVKLIEAPMVFQPVISYAPNSLGAQDYMKLSKEVLELVSKKN